MKPHQSTNELNASRALDHLRAAVRYASRGREVFFNSEIPDTFLLVESELRKAYESLNRLGQSFYAANRRFDRERIGTVRQLLTHDYADVDKALIWKVAQDEAPDLIHLLARAKIPKSE